MKPPQSFKEFLVIINLLIPIMLAIIIYEDYTCKKIGVVMAVIIGFVSINIVKRIAKIFE